MEMADPKDTQPGSTGPSEQQQKGAADKAAAERRTQEVARQNEADQADRRPLTVSEAQEQGAEISERIGTDQTPSRADDAPERAPVDAHADPFPDYARQGVDDLASLAESRGVEINRDVEKAQLIRALRDNDGKAVAAGEAGKQVEGASNPYASYDVMPLEELRKLAQEREVELDPDFVKAHLITELRAADTGVAGTGVSVRLN